MLGNEPLVEALTFDDVMLLPAESEVLPRDVDVRTRLTERISLQMPLVSSAMDTVTEADTAITMAREGGLGVIHKNLSIEQQAREVQKVKRAESGMVFDPVVVHPDENLRRALPIMRESGVSGLPVVVEGRAVGIFTNRDVRVEKNRHPRGVVDAGRAIRKSFGAAQIIAGNAATADAYVALVKAGADGVKVGIGPGSICTTRVVAGVGVPQITAISECARAAEKHGKPIIADGGIKYSGDVAKAIAAGGHTVMIGSLFAGTDEAPGEVILHQGRSYKQYRGMGSIGAMQAGSKDRYFQSHVSTAEPEQARKLVPE